MDDASLIKAHIATIAYNVGFPDGADGMRAVAFCLRNRFDAGWWNGDWTNILNHYADLHPTDPPKLIIPDPRIYSVHLLLQELDGIFDGTVKDDVTVPKVSILSQSPPPCLYWARLNEITNERFLEEISRRPDLHPRSAQVGTLTMFS